MSSEKQGGVGIKFSLTTPEYLRASNEAVSNLQGYLNFFLFVYNTPYMLFIRGTNSKDLGSPFSFEEPVSNKSENQHVGLEEN